MTLALDGLAFQTYFRRLELEKKLQEVGEEMSEEVKKLLEDAKEILIRVRTSPPSRTLEACKGNMPVGYPSKKMQCIIKAESHKVEFGFLLEAEHDDTVLEFYDQPPPIQLEYTDRNNRTQRPLHTADYFVFRYRSAGWEECKQVGDLLRLAQQSPNRYMIDDLGQWRCPPGEAFAAKYGLTYRVRSSDQINWAAQDNWLYIEDYYQDIEKLEVPEAALETLYRLVDESRGITLSDLRVAASEISADTINIAIAKHALYVDLATQRLTEPEHAQVFRNDKTARAHQHRGSGAEDIGVDAHPVTITQGSTVLWDGRLWHIAVGQTEIMLTCDGSDPFPLKRSAFDALVREGKIVGVQTETRSSFTEEGQERLARAREVDDQTAVFRNRVINPDQYDDDEQLKIPALAEKIPARTKRSWQQLYQEAEITYGSGFIGLIPDYANCGGKKKVDLSVVGLIQEVLKTHYNTVTRKPKRGAYGEYVVQSKEKSLPTVSQRTFYGYAKRQTTMYEEVLSREGARAAYPFKEYHHPSEKTTNRHGTYAWAMAHIDHMEVDLMLCDSKTGKPIGKCWLTLMILTHPRRIAAFYLSFDPPSYRSCMMVLRLCVKRFGRLPTAITVDGGPEFKSVYFEKLLALYKVRKHRRPTAEPRFGSPLERLFDTMDTEFIYHLLGNTQATKDPRKMTKATNPRHQAVWTLALLAECVQQWADEEYDTIEHPALHQSPREAYDQSIKRDGEREHKRIPYDEVFRMATFPTTNRGRSIVQPGRGVRMNYLDYWCDEMRDRSVERTQVPVRYDPFDVAVGYAYIDKQWRKCICVADELSGCSERELQFIAAELRQLNRLHHGRAQVEVTQKQLADFRRTNVAKQDLQRQQRNDRETKAAFAVLEGGRGKDRLASLVTSYDTSEPVQSEQNSNQYNEHSVVPPLYSPGNGKLRVLKRLR